MATTTALPLSTRSASRPLSIDLSNLPPLVAPSPPSNTLLITNLQDPSIFHPASLLTIRDLINTHAPLHSFSPLKSFRRIVTSFYTIDDAIRIRQLLDGEVIMGDLVRIYFGESTPIEIVDKHLAAPKSNKLFFISPPPSPPHGWMMRDEAPPNKDVHADDLATALAKLHARSGPREDLDMNGEEETHREGDKAGSRVANRARSGSSTIVYHPEDHGDSPFLPAVMVEDTTEEGGLDGMAEARMLAHTARPPLELMGDA